MSSSGSQVVDLINQEELPSSVQAELAIKVNSDQLTLDVDGPEVELKLSTVLAEKVIKSRRIEGLVARGYNEDVEIPLPKKLLKIIYTG